MAERRAAAPTPSSTGDVDARTARIRLTADDRRAQILKAAGQLFAQHPYAAVSTSDIALAAGTTRTNVHYYFGTKRGVYLAVIRQFGQVAELPPASAGRATGPAELARLFDRWLDVLERNPQMIMMGIGALAPGADPDVAAVFRSGLRAWEDRLLAVLELPDQPSTRAAIRAFQGLVAVATTEWLSEQTLTKDEVHLLITRTMLALAGDVVRRTPSS